MLYLNDYDLARYREAYARHPVLGPAVETLEALIEWTNANSDGWAYWPKPCRAAEKLQALIQGPTVRSLYDDPRRADATPERLRAAYVPIKAFLTRHRNAGHTTAGAFHFSEPREYL